MILLLDFPDHLSSELIRAAVRFQESNLFQELFERIVEQCIQAGLVQGEQMSVDGSFIQASADHHTRIPREQFFKIFLPRNWHRDYCTRCPLP